MKRSMIIIILFFMFVSSVLALDDIQLQNSFEQCKKECKESLPFFRCDELCNIEDIKLFYNSHEPSERYTFEEKTFLPITFNNILKSSSLSSEVIANEVLKDQSSLLQTNGEDTFLFVPTLRYNFMKKVNNGQLKLDLINNNNWLGELTVVSTIPSEEVITGVVKTKAGAMFLHTAAKGLTFKNKPVDIFFDTRLNTLQDHGTLDVAIEEVSADLQEQIKSVKGDSALAFAKINPIATSFSPRQTFITVRFDKSLLANTELGTIQAVIIKDKELVDAPIDSGGTDGGYSFEINSADGVYPVILYSGTINVKLPSEPVITSSTSNTPQEEPKNKNIVFQWILIALFVVLVLMTVWQQMKTGKKK